MIEKIIEKEGNYRFKSEQEKRIWLSIRNTIYRDYVVQTTGVDKNYVISDKSGWIRKFGRAIYYFPSLISIILMLPKHLAIVFITGANVHNNNSKQDAFLSKLRNDKIAHTSISFGENKLDAQFSLYSLFFISNVFGVIGAFFQSKKKLSERYRFISNLLGNSHELTVSDFYLYRKSTSHILFASWVHKILEFKAKKKFGAYIEEGFYQHNSFLTKKLKELDCLVYEHQHGVMHNQHDAYNYPKNKFSEYADYQPDRLLLFSDSWQKVISVHCKTEVIGWYKIGDKIDEKSGRFILFIGTGINSEQSIDLYLTLAKKFHKEKWIFRPHPMERALVTKIYSGEIDVGSLASSLSNAKLVIGETSTVLFDANALGNKVIAIESEYSKGSGLDKVLSYCSRDDLMEVIEKALLI